VQIVYAPSIQPAGIATASGSDTICIGESTTLSLQGGALGDNAKWYWYTDGCGTGMPIDSGNTILVTPSDTVTQYYVASAGGCNMVCQSVIINWNPDCTALPLRILAFDAQLYQQSKAFINWQATDEEKGTVYRLEKSTDGKVFVLLNQREASGKPGKTDYAFIDQTLAIGKNYYRLKSVEPDGKVSYTNIKVVVYKLENDYVRLYPNPTGINLIYFEFSGEVSNKVDYWITDIAGQNVYNLKTIQAKNGKNKISISLNDLAQGAYLFHYQNSNGTSAHIKFVKTD